VRLSVIIPTRNRAHLWRAGWATDTLRRQTDPPDELVVACDNPDDDTIDAVTESTRSMPFPVRVLDLVAGRPGPNPASAVPDNCLFHAAQGDVILHLDDDLAVHPDLCRRIRALLDSLPRAIIYPHLRFVDEKHQPLTDHDSNDCRLDISIKRRWPTLPGGLRQLPSERVLHWGAAWAVPRRELLAIGGHCLALAQFHNADTRLGSRLVKSGCSSFLGVTPELTIEHLGPTWFAKHKHDQAAIRASQGPYTGPTIANGGPAFWNSDWIRSAYRELDIPKTVITI